MLNIFTGNSFEKENFRVVELSEIRLRPNHPKILVPLNHNRLYHQRILPWGHYSPFLPTLHTAIILVFPAFHLSFTPACSRVHMYNGNCLFTSQLDLIAMQF